VLNEVKPDVAHVHHLLFLSVGILDELKKRKIPVVFTLHDYWLTCPRGQLLKNNLELCKDPINANCLSCLASGLNPRTILKKMFKFLSAVRPAGKFRINIKDVCGKVDLFIAPSRYLRDRFIKFGIPEEKIIYSDNGMNLSLFEDIEKTKSDKLRFGFIGTLIPSKGIHVLIKAFNGIKGGRAILKIYGKSPANNGIFDYYHKIERMAGGNKSIKFMGIFDNKDAAKIFKEIDVLVFPSLWEENSPLVLHEAIMSRTTVIASDVGGVAELINHKGNGFLFKAGNVKNLFMRINDAMGQKGLFDNIKDRETAIKDIKENSEEMENIYKNLLLKKG
jgi:glycosyltransferase involved in cell wall biosynthesis